MLEVLTSIDFLKFAIPLLGAVAAWFVNERAKRLAEQYLRKETSYKELLIASQGFVAGVAEANNLKREFLKQLNLSWLYCSDDVILKGYAFLAILNQQSEKTDAEKNIAHAEFILAIRKDLLSRTLIRRTSLDSSVYKHYLVGAK